MAHKQRVVLAVLLILGVSGWMASAALAGPAAPTFSAAGHERLAVVGSATAMVLGNDEQGVADQLTADPGDGQAAENDSNAQRGDSNIQAGDAGLTGHAIANQPDTPQAGDNQVDQQNVDTGTLGAGN